MTKETKEKIQAAYKDMEDSRVAFNIAFHKLLEKHGIVWTEEEKNSVNDPYQAMTKNIITIGKLFQENL